MTDDPVAAALAWADNKDSTRWLLDRLGPEEEQHINTLAAAVREWQGDLVLARHERRVAMERAATAEADLAALKARMTEAALADDCHHCSDPKPEGAPCWWCGRVAAKEADDAR